MVIDTLRYFADKAANLAKDIEEWSDPGAVLLDMHRSLQLDGYSCGVQSAYMILRYRNYFRSRWSRWGR